MDSDFKYQAPKQTDSPQDSQNSLRSDDTSGASQTATVPSSHLLAAYAEGGRKKDHGLLVFVVMLILLVAAVGGEYVWARHDLDSILKINDSAASASQQQIDSLKSQLAVARDTAAKATASATQASDLRLVPGEVTAPAVGKANVTVMYKPDLKVSEMWVEYGDAPDKLSQTSKHQTSELGLGPSAPYMTYSVPLTGLKTGTRYYFRGAAKASGSVVYSSVSTFVSTK